MTQEYSEALARDIFAMTRGLEKHILPGGRVSVTILPDGSKEAEVSSQTVTGATVTHVFRAEGNHAVYTNTYNTNIYGDQTCVYR